MNRKISIVILSILILMLGGLAIFLAITINNRNVNPDETSASEGNCIDFNTCVNNCVAESCKSKESALKKCLDDRSERIRECERAKQACISMYPSTQCERLRQELSQCKESLSQASDACAEPSFLLNKCIAEKKSSSACAREQANYDSCKNSQSKIKERCDNLKKNLDNCENCGELTKQSCSSQYPESMCDGARKDLESCQKQRQNLCAPECELTSCRRNNKQNNTNTPTPTPTTNDGNGNNAGGTSGGAGGSSSGSSRANGSNTGGNSGSNAGSNAGGGGGSTGSSNDSSNASGSNTGGNTGGNSGGNSGSNAGNNTGGGGGSAGGSSGSSNANGNNTGGNSGSSGGSSGNSATSTSGGSTTQSPTPTPDPRPDLCRSATVSRSTLGPGQSLTITSTAKTNNIRSFTYGFYNLDNLDGLNNPKPIYFEANTHYIITEPVNPPRDSYTITISYEQLRKSDLNWNGGMPSYIQVNAYFADTEGRFSSPNPACVVRFRLEDQPQESRPDLCQSATVSRSTLGPGESLTITSTAKTNNIRSFTYGFYNLDNLYGPNNPKPIYFEANTHYIITEPVNPVRNSYTITISYDQLRRSDLNWNGGVPSNIQVNAYFTDTDGRFSSPNSACVVSFRLVNSTQNQTSSGSSSQSSSGNQSTNQTQNQTPSQTSGGSSQGTSSGNGSTGSSQNSRGSNGSNLPDTGIEDMIGGFIPAGIALILISIFGFRYLTKKRFEDRVLR